jgi:hypothetical protein
VNPVVSFSILRLALFAAVLVALYALGARGLLLLVLTAVISLALSYVLLAGPRAAVTRTIEERAAGRRSGTGRRTGDDEAAEDKEADESR